MAMKMRAQRKLTFDQIRDSGQAMVLLTMLAAWFTHRWEFVTVAMALMLVCMIRPVLFRPWAFLWMALSSQLEIISSTTILSLLYILVVTPVGVARRLFGADPMQHRRWKDGQGSLLRVREHLYRPYDLEKPF